MSESPVIIGDCRLYRGDCLDILPRLEADSVDAIVTDPPYELKFMGRKWDGSGVAFQPETWEAVLRVLQPGGFLLSFGGTRTWHRLACAIEDGGFYLFDTLMWLHGQGFPKGKSQLKPAWEPVLCARCPGKGVRPLGIDECRIVAGDSTRRTNLSAMRWSGGWDSDGSTSYETGSDAGRWPANLVLSHHAACRPVGTRRVKGTRDSLTNRSIRQSETWENGSGFKNESNCRSGGYAAADGLETVEAYECVDGCPVKALDEQAGERKSNSGKPFNRNTDKTRNSFGHFVGERAERGYYGDTGSASRFFYCPKASRAAVGAGNTHPTVKSTALMAWLVKLVCPPGGLVLDPFLGSGSTAVACVQAGRRCVGIEKDPDYFNIACRRLAGMAGPLFQAAAT